MSTIKNENKQGFKPICFTVLKVFCPLFFCPPSGFYCLKLCALRVLTGCSFFICAFFSHAYVAIDVGQAWVRESNMAFPPLVLDHTKGPGGTSAKTNLWQKTGPKGETKAQTAPTPSPLALRAGTTIFNTLSHNFVASSYFKLIEPEAFLEQPGEKGLKPYPKDPNGFRWKNWQILNADYLVLGKYFVQNQKVYLDLYLYHVPLRRKVFHKKYSAGMNALEKLAHVIGNDIIEALTSRPGIFLTKITAVKSMGNNKKEIFVMDWNGKNQQRVSFHQSVALNPVWSPSGTHIAYTAFLYRKSRQKRVPSLLLYNRENRTRRILLNKQAIVGDFFPNGKHLLVSLFLNPKGGDMDIARLSLADRGLSPLTSGPNGAINVEPALTPNGKSFVFSSDRGGKVMLYAQPLKGGGRPKLITYKGSYNSTPEYSPDGEQIVFSGYAHGRFDIFIMNKNGKGLRRLTSFKKRNGRWANHESPSFSPDGRHIVFSSDRSGTYQLYIMNVSTLNVLRITSSKLNFKSPKWSPQLKN